MHLVLHDLLPPMKGVVSAETRRQQLSDHLVELLPLFETSPGYAPWISPDLLPRNYSDLTLWQFLAERDGETIDDFRRHLGSLRDGKSISLEAFTKAEGLLMSLYPGRSS